MTESYDPLLQNLFAEARQELDGEVLTSRVMAKTRRFRYLLLTSGISAVLLILAVAWLIFAIPLLEFAVLLSQGLTMTLIDLGEGWLALVLMPVNNIASLCVISAKAIHLGWKKILNASFSN